VWYNKFRYLDNCLNKEDNMIIEKVIVGKDTKYPLAPGSWVESIKLPSPFTDNGNFRYVVGINGSYTIAGGE
jgi:hypothetical protein